MEYRYCTENNRTLCIMRQRSVLVKHGWQYSVRHNLATNTGMPPIKITVTQDRLSLVNNPKESGCWEDYDE